MKQHFPRDFATFIRYHTEPKKIPARHPLPEPPALHQLNTFLAEAGRRYQVHRAADT